MIVWQLGNLLSRDHLLVPLPDWLSAEKIQRLNEGLREIFVSLMDLRGADEHSFTAKWSMKEVRELLYDTQDYMDKYEYPPYYFGNYITLSWIGNNVFKMRRPQIAKDFSELMVHFNDVSKRLKSSCLFFFFDNQKFLSWCGRSRCQLLRAPTVRDCKHKRPFGPGHSCY